MLKIIAIALLAAGCAALIAGIIIFIVTGGLNLLKEIKQAKNVSFDYSTQNTASDIYYNKADNIFTEPKKKAKFKNVDADDQEKEKSSGYIPQSSPKGSDFSVEETDIENIDSGDLIAQTSPLSEVNMESKPVSETDEYDMFEEIEKDTSPLQDLKVDDILMTAPLTFEPADHGKEQEGAEERDTAPLVFNPAEDADAGFEDLPGKNTTPLTFEGIDGQERDTMMLGDIEDAFDFLIDSVSSKEDETKESKWQTSPLISEPAENDVPEKSTAPLMPESSDQKGKEEQREHDTAPLIEPAENDVPEKSTAPLMPESSDQKGEEGQREHDTAPLIEKPEDMPIPKEEDRSHDTMPLTEQNGIVRKDAEDAPAEHDTAPLVKQQKEEQGTKDTMPLTEENLPVDTELLKNAPELSDETNTAPLEKEYEEDVIDEISGIKPNKEDDLFVDFEELFGKM